MGRVRTKLVKRASRQIIEKFYSRLTMDFDTNKKICEEVAIIPTKRLRNKVAGFATHLMKRIQRGPVRGISLKLQEEERERRMDFVPERSVLDQEKIEVDAETMQLLRSLDFPDIPGVEKASVGAPYEQHRGGRGGRGGRGRGGRGGGERRGGRGGKGERRGEEDAGAAPAAAAAAPTPQ